jgi:hypothetical protein
MLSESISESQRAGYPRRGQIRTNLGSEQNESAYTQIGTGAPTCPCFDSGQFRRLRVQQILAPEAAVSASFR